MVGLLHAMAFMVLLRVAWVIWNNKPLPLPTKYFSTWQNIIASALSTNTYTTGYRVSLTWSLSSNDVFAANTPTFEISKVPVVVLKKSEIFAILIQSNIFIE